MFKKTTKILSLTIILVLLVGLFAGCGATMENGAAIDKYYPVTESPMEGGFDGILNDSISNSTSDSTGSAGSGDSSQEQKPVTQQKIIQTYDFSVETLKFDEAIAELEKKVFELGGYIEKSSSYGNESKYYNNRSASYVLRIPVEKSTEFTDYISGSLIVIEKKVGTKDVTSQYIDVESRLKALRTEKAVLENLLAKATTMSDVLSIQKQLTNVIYEIETYEAKIRTYDNLIAYSTVNVHISEVEEPTVVKELTVWEKIAEGFGDNFDDVVNDFTDLFVWFVSAIPKLIVFVVFNGIIFLIVRYCIKKGKKKKEIQKAQQAATEAKEAKALDETVKKHDPTKPFENQ
jgi:hypothetical protein